MWGNPLAGYYVTEKWLEVTEVNQKSTSPPPPNKQTSVQGRHNAANIWVGERRGKSRTGQGRWDRGRTRPGSGTNPMLPNPSTSKSYALLSQKDFPWFCACRIVGTDRRPINADCILPRVREQMLPCPKEILAAGSPIGYSSSHFDTAVALRAVSA